ncbi:MAG: fused MFS/spermidine synthase [Phycisphaerales bacterium]|nr:fused MFS/spermidine synthase [Phycisphaerales bacterium]
MIIVFTLTVFLSAGLLFSVQPMVAKSLLPAFGGGSSVWTTCMLFYQVLLLLGYLYAHVLMTRFSRRSQLVIHSILLVAAITIGVLFDTPVAPENASTFPVPWLILQLSLISGLPFFAISSAGPLIQGWFARTGHERAHDPYFLYAASNAGSLIGLLAYPFLFEPNLGIAAQRQYWLIGFGVFILLAMYAASRTQKATKETPKQRKRRLKEEARLTVVSPGDDDRAVDDVITFKRRLFWIYLAFIPSTMLLGVTTYITTDVVSLPLLWILPLVLYLITMIIAFGSKSQRAVKDFTRPMVLSTIAAMILLMASEMSAELSMVMVILIELLLLTSVGIVCHGRLAMNRPAAKHLTEFYLLMSVGGALGGFFNGIIAPLFFITNFEYAIALVLAVSVLPWSADLVNLTKKKARFVKIRRRVGYPLCLLLYVLVVGFYGTEITNFVNQFLPTSISEGFTVNMTMVFLMTVVPSVMIYLAWKDGLACAITIFLPLFAIQYNSVNTDSVIYIARTFYGTHEVHQDFYPDTELGRLVKIHTLKHGTTKHGVQFLDPAFELEPLGYYHSNGPCGTIMRTIKSMRPEGARIGIMGLGSGAIVAHGRPQDNIVFFEIDPEVKRIAENPELFTYLSNARTQIEVRLGDARKLIEDSQENQEEKFDLLHADAFTSDSIPVHLVTKEAIELYFDRLTDDGMIVLHISNRYLDLEPLVYELSIQTTGLPPMVFDDVDISEEDMVYHYPSKWMVITKDVQTAIRLGEAGMLVSGVADEDRVQIWTDDFSDIISLIRWH